MEGNPFSRNKYPFMCILKNLRLLQSLILGKSVPQLPGVDPTGADPIFWLKFLEEYYEI